MVQHFEAATQNTYMYRVQSPRSDGAEDLFFVAHALYGPTLITVCSSCSTNNMRRVEPRIEWDTQAIVTPGNNLLGGYDRRDIDVPSTKAG